MVAPAPAIRITKNGRIAERHFAQRRGFTCCHCHEDIPRFSYYYTVTYAGAGLGGIKFPDRCHEHCVEAYLNA